MGKRSFQRLCKSAASSHSHAHHKTPAEEERGPPPTVDQLLHESRRVVPASSALSLTSSSSGRQGHPGLLRSESLAAGPIPRSWRRANYQALYRGREPKEERPSGREATLFTRSLEVLARNLHVYLPGEGQDPRGLFSYVPPLIKARILRVVSRHARLNDRTLLLFEDEALDVLDISFSEVTVAGLERLSPDVAHPIDPASSTWEEQEHTGRGIELRGCPNLRELNASFCPRLRGMALSMVLGQHFRFLEVLRLAGMDGEEGPEALVLLSESLALLRVLELSHCHWLARQDLLRIDWAHHWRRLDLLELRGCSPSLAALASRLHTDSGRWIELVV